MLAGFHTIDEHLRSKAVQDAKRFEHLAQQAASRSSEPVHKKPASTGSSWSEKITKMRETYPNAYMPWSTDDDDVLKQEFQNGVTIKALSKKLGRHEGSIKMRLQKHFGEDIVQ